MHDIHVHTPLRKLRIEAGFTQEQAATAMGVTQATVSRMEAGIVPTPPDRLAMFITLIAQHRRATDAEALELDVKRPDVELAGEILAFADFFRAIGTEMQMPGADVASLERLGEAGMARLRQIQSALLARMHTTVVPQ